MTSNHLLSSLLFTVSFSVLLAGCHSTAMLSPQQTAAISTPSIVDKYKPVDELSIQESQVMQWSAHYDWQLAEVSNQSGNTVNITNFTPITLEVAPSSVRFYQGCEQYKMDFHAMTAAPYPYYSYLVRVPTTCNDDNNFNHNTAIKEEESVQSLFAKSFPVRLNFELLPTPQLTFETVSIDSQSAPKRLALNIENGDRLIFTGSAKALALPTGLPITNKLLEQYDWQLVSAVHNTFDDNKQLTRAPIGDFYHPDYPVSLEFRNSPDGPYVAFNANCNGSSAPYFLLTDNTFKISNILSSAINCGKTGDRIETALFDLMRDSSSQLILSLQPSKQISPSSKIATDTPRYNLLQTMASGETLVWQNKEKSQR